MGRDVCDHDARQKAHLFVDQFVAHQGIESARLGELHANHSAVVTLFHALDKL